MNDAVPIVLLILAILSLAALALALLIVPLLGALKLKNDTDKLVWALVIIFLYPLGSLVYLVVRPHNRETETK